MKYKIQIQKINSLAIFCEITKINHLSPLIYKGKIEFSKENISSFWTFEIYSSQLLIRCQLMQSDTKSQNRIIALGLIKVNSQYFKNQAQSYNIKSNTQSYKIKNKKYSNKIYLKNQNEFIAILTYQIKNPKNRMKRQNLYHPLIVPKLQELEISRIYQKQQVSKSKLANNKVHILRKDQTQKQITQSDDEQRQRFQPLETINQSLYSQISSMKNQFKNDFNYSNQLEMLIDQSTQERYKFTVQHQKDPINNQVSQLNQSLPQSCLQKWVNKIKQNQQRTKQSLKFVQYQCKIEKNTNAQTSQRGIRLCLKNIKLPENEKISKPKNQKTLKLKELKLSNIKNQIKNQNIIDQICNCNLLMRPQQYNQQFLNEIKFKHAIFCIPENQNLLITISMIDSNDLIQGVFIKQQYLKDKRIPLFLQNKQDLFGYLNYNVKTIQSVSIQSLPQLQELPQYSQSQKNSDKSLTVQNDSVNIFRLKQRKLIKRQQINRIIKPKQEDYHIQHDSFVSNKSTRKISQNYIHQQDSSPFKLKRSNTEIHNVNQNTQNKDGRASNISKKYKLRLNSHTLETLNQPQHANSKSTKQDKSKQVYFHNENTLTSKLQNLSQLTNQISRTSNYEFERSSKEEIFSPQKISSKNLKRHNFTPFQKKQTLSKRKYSHYDNMDPMNESKLYPTQKQIQNNQLNQLRRRMFTELDCTTFQVPKKIIDESFIIQIQSLTVIPYKMYTEQQKEKFLILKSEKGETIITQKIEHSHMHLTWRNKDYQFTHNQIKISLFQSITNPSHSIDQYAQSQAILLGNTAIQFNLSKGGQQNFIRNEITKNGLIIGTIVVFYQILNHKLPFIQLRKNKNNLQDIQQNQSKRYQKQKIINLSTPKDYDSKIYRPHKQSQAQRLSQMTIKKKMHRIRSKTIQTNSLQQKKKFNLPTFQTIKQDSPTRRNRIYQGGKNIKIGRAHRFTNSNMAEMIGQI